MSLSKKTIETLSVDAVRDSVMMSNYLDQYIPDDDKEPFWDGGVYIYKNKDHVKDNFSGRMPVQVKGKVCDDLSKEEITYQIKTSDLRAYLVDGGAIYFVVYIGNNGLARKIYYVELTPMRIRFILERAGNQKSKAVKLKEFPTDIDKKTTIFMNCLQNCKKQNSFSNAHIYTLDELQSQGVLENITIPISGVGIQKDPQMALISNDVYVYANIKGSSIPHPVKMLPEGTCTRQVLDAKITIDEKIFYTECEVIRSVKTTTFCYGSSFKMTFNEQEEICKIRYKNSPNIRVLAKDLNFILTYMDKGYFNFNDVEIPFDYEGMDSNNFDIEEERKHLQFAKNIVKVLDMLGCTDDINIDDMEEVDWRNLERLITAFIDKKPVEGLNKNLSPVSCMKIGKLRLVFYLKKIKGTDKYEIYDFFKAEVSVAVKGEEDEMIPVSPFCILSENDILTLNNINFDVLLPSFQELEHNYETFNRANNFLLMLLNAYDKANDEERKEKILKVCYDFSNWILEATDGGLEYEIKVLNQLQTIKRRREFTIDEINTLYELIEDSNTSKACVVGAYLLLGQQLSAERHFAKLSKEEQKNFKEFPIYHFWET